MIRSVLIGTAFAASSAFIVYAHDTHTETEEKRDYRAQVVDTGAGHQGREYVSNGVLVIEGAPRWTEMRHASSTRQVPRFLEPFFGYFD
jgi:hypothetical protein